MNKIRKTCLEDLNRERERGGVGSLNKDTQTVAFQNTTLLRFMSACAGIHNSALSFFLHVCVYIQQGITQAGLCLWSRYPPPPPPTSPHPSSPASFMTPIQHSDITVFCRPSVLSSKRISLWNWIQCIYYALLCKCIYGDGVYYFTVWNVRHETCDCVLHCLGIIK